MTVVMVAIIYCVSDLTEVVSANMLGYVRISSLSVGSAWTRPPSLVPSPIYARDDRLQYVHGKDKCAHNNSYLDT